MAGREMVCEPKISRRQALQLGAGVAATTLLAACTRALSPESSPMSSAVSSTSSTTPPTSTTFPAPTTVAYDPDLPYWLQGNFAPVPTEIDAFDLVVEGSLPRELSGLYVRNGSNPAGGASSHWFLGDGMIHGVRLDNGRASWYRNRWVETPLLGRGDILGGGNTGAPGGANNSSNTSVVQFGNRLLSLQEVGFPYEISTADLSTVGAWDMGGGLTTAMTAHPKIDPRTGLLHFFGYGFTPPYLTYHVANAAGEVLTSQEIAVGGPTMIHDFAITDRDVVFWELPVVFQLDLALAGELPFVWDPSYGARIGTFPLGGPASEIRWVEIDPCYVFHGTNAWRDGAGDDAPIVLDVSRLDSMFAPGGDGDAALHRWRLTTDPAGGSLVFADEVIEDRSLDLPGIDRRLTGVANRHAWYATTRDALGGFDFGGIVHRYDGRFEEWVPPSGESAGEPFFVARGNEEGDGWILAFGYDANTDRSDLLVFDAPALASGPIARVKLPRRVPYGFHGWWLSADQLA